MIARRLDPVASYRRVELDARAEGSSGLGLTQLCLEVAMAELDLAALADRSGNSTRRTAALSRASRALLALSSGVAPDNPLAGPLQQLYEAGRMAVQRAMFDYGGAALGRVRDDLAQLLMHSGGAAADPLRSGR